MPVFAPKCPKDESIVDRYTIAPSWMTRDPLETGGIICRIKISRDFG